MEYLGVALIIIGLFVILCGVFGLYKFTDFFVMVHICSVIDCVGIPCFIVGIMFFQHDISQIIKLLLIFILVFILNPVSTHALCAAKMRNTLSKNKSKLPNSTLHM